MTCNPRLGGRRGATVVEYAVIAPILFLLLFGIIIGGLGVYRYFQVAALAREGARWASVHGAQYQQETGLPPTTATAIQNHVRSQAVAFDQNKLNCTVTWNTSNAPQRFEYNNGTTTATQNTVSVTVTYDWYPEVFLIGPIRLTSTSTMPMSY